MTRSQIRLRSPFRRCADIVIGSLAMILGVILIFTPGPAVLVLPIGLALLGREFRWARQGNLALRRKYRNLIRSNTSSRASKPRLAPTQRAPRAHFAFNHQVRSSISA